MCDDLCVRWLWTGVLSGGHDYPVKFIRTGFANALGQPLVVTCDPEDPALLVWDVLAGQCVSRLRGHGADSSTVIVAVTGRLVDPLAAGTASQLVCSVDNKGVAIVWDVVRGVMHTEMPVVEGGGDGDLPSTPPTAAVQVLRVGGAQQALAVGYASGGVRVWCMDTGTCVRALRACINTGARCVSVPVAALSWAAGRSQIAVAHDDGVLRLWDTEMGTCRLSRTCKTVDAVFHVHGALRALQTPWNN
jgi:WD40 repeat protein